LLSYAAGMGNGLANTNQVLAFMGYMLGYNFNVIGLTGGIATGKSTVSNILRKDFDFTIIDADEISKQLRKHDKGYHQALISTFGEKVFDFEKNEINSEVLGNIVFSDRKALDKLNGITHWRIFWNIFCAIIYHKFILLK
jgi:dephospho-CoA kinase